MTEELKKDQKCQQVYEPQSDIKPKPGSFLQREQDFCPRKIGYENMHQVD